MALPPQPVLLPPHLSRARAEAIPRRLERDSTSPLPASRHGNCRRSAILHHRGTAWRLQRRLLLFSFPISDDNGNLAAAARHRRIIIIAACSASGAVLLLIIAAAIGCYCYFRRKKNLPAAPAAQEEELGLIQAAIERYTLSDIQEATNGFERQIGSGGSAEVYYGKLADGTEIAAKSLLNLQHQQSVDDFTDDVKLLSRIHHRNLVQFLGYSQQSEKRILVYEYMQNGTLKQHLPGGGSGLLTSWVQRLQIAGDVARGMEYMHTGCTPAIVHRDLKTGNILLDNNWRAKIADFGLSKPMVDGAQVSRRDRGTIGYLDPYPTAELSEKRDIYSFGVILLELISGREVIHGGPDGAVSIITWARPQIESGNVEAIIDASLDVGYTPESVQMIADLAIQCVRSHVTQRPTSSDIVRYIEDAVRVELQVEAPEQMPMGDADSDYSPDPEMRQAFHEISHAN